jgi:hypothetical protein
MITYILIQFDVRVPELYRVLCILTTVLLSVYRITLEAESTH